MPSFHYTALNKDNKNLTGVIEATDEQSARSKMNEMKLSVVSLELIKDGLHAPQEGKTVFEFAAKDKNGKKVIGTITAENAVKAYGRLFDEYELNIIYIVPLNATDEEKEKLRKEGILGLQHEYEKLPGKKSKLMQQDDATSKKEEEKKELLQKIDFTIQRIQDFLQRYNADLKIEERDIIQAYINQLIRIKDSTNLEHIRTTCEKMLSHIQQQELFIHEEQKASESAELKAETHEMLDDLKRNSLNKEIDILKLAPFLKPIADFFSEKNPAILTIKNEIKINNKHLWTYLKFLILGKSKLQRIEAFNSIKTLLAERKRLKLKLKAIKEETKTTSTISESIGTALGWISAFYILSYIVSYPFTIKIFGNPVRLPKGFYFYDSTFMKIVTLLLFIAYCTATIRDLWLKENQNARYLLYPATLFGFILIVINLM